MNYPSEASLAKQEQWMRDRQHGKREKQRLDWERKNPTPEQLLDRRRMPWPRHHEERSLIPSTWPALEAAMRLWGAPTNGHGVCVPFMQYHRKRTTKK